MVVCERKHARMRNAAMPQLRESYPRRGSSDSDVLILRGFLRELPTRAFRAIVLRYWCRYSTEEVARALKLSWDAADLLISRSEKTLRANCLSDLRFSRSMNQNVLKTRERTPKC